MGLTYVCSGAGILKLISIGLGVICFIVGSVAFFDKEGKELPPLPTLPTTGDGVEKFEPYFIIIVGIMVVISAVDIVICLLCDCKGCCNILDMIYHIAGGILLIIAGSVLIAAALKIDDRNAVLGFKPSGFVLEELRKSQKYGEKLGAGALSILNGLMYIVTACIVFKGNGN